MIYPIILLNFVNLSKIVSWIHSCRVHSEFQRRSKAGNSPLDRRRDQLKVACVLDTHIDPDHNRSVITFVAPPEKVVEAAVTLSGELRSYRHAYALR